MRIMVDRSEVGDGILSSPGKPLIIKGRKKSNKITPCYVHTMEGTQGSIEAM